LKKKRANKINEQMPEAEAFWNGFVFMIFFNFLSICAFYPALLIITVSRSEGIV
jgi:hypothetical protein